MSGLELVSALKNVPDIIFTTAYHEYALGAFNLNAIDYLLKPFSYERFLQAISKSSYNSANKDSTPSVEQISGSDVLLVNNKEIPVSQMYREALMARLNLL